ncbi:anti-repressor SinI family protein [Peribacillus sp. SCS-155]
MVFVRICEQLDLDREWVQLIIEAKDAGLKIEEIRDFLIKSRGQEIL